MHDIDLRAIDLNLLVVLDVLLEERSVSRTAKRIGRTQSATSHALARLREQLNDPLLVRVGGAMQPTPRAERIAVDLRRVLRSLNRVLVGEADFDPTETTRTFTLAGPDFLAMHAAELVASLHADAPSARFELAKPSRQMFVDLVDARIDVVVSPPQRHRLDGVDSEVLSELDWVVFARRGHPAAKRWGLRAWSKHPHVQIRTAAERGPVDVAVQEAGRERHVAAWMPSFAAAAKIVANTDLLLTAPRAVLGADVERYGLLTLRCPLSIPPIELHLFRAAHLGRDSAVSFFADLVREALT